MKHRNKLIFLAALYLSIIVDVYAVRNRAPEIKTLKWYSRLTFPVNSTTTFKVHRSKERKSLVRLEVNDFNYKIWKELSLLQDKRIKEIRYEPINSKKVNIFIDFIEPESEFFSYFQPSPPGVVIDIWPKKKELVQKEKERKKQKIQKKQKIREIASIKRKKIEAEQALMVDPLNLKDYFFLKFHVQRPTYIYSGRNFDTTRDPDPGAGWKWTKGDINVAGGVGFSLATKLFKLEKYALCIKAIKYTEEQFPNTIYSGEMSFLEAIAYRKLGYMKRGGRRFTQLFGGGSSGAKTNLSLVREGNRILKELMTKQDKDGNYLPFSDRLRMFFAAEAYRRGRWVEAIDHFEFIANREEGIDKKDLPGILISMAESYLALRQFRRAERIYKNIVEHYGDSEIGKEATYRIGILHAYEGNYKRAIEVYKNALAKYPKYEKKREESYFNLAEAYFWLGRYKESLENFKEFYNRHSSITLAALALARIGEIEELINNNQKLAYKFYDKARNKFPFSLGSKIANARVARLTLKTESDIDYQIKALKLIANDRNIVKKVRFMANNTLISYLLLNNDVDEAINLSRSSMSETEGKGLDIFKNKYIISLSTKFKWFQEENKLAEALKHYKEYKIWIDKKGPEVENILAKVYKGLNLHKTSEKQIASYINKIIKNNNGRIPASLNKKQDSRNLLNARLLFMDKRYSQALKLAQGLKDSADRDRIIAVSTMRLGKESEAQVLAEKAINKYIKQKSILSKDRFQEGIIDLTEVMLTWVDKRKEYDRMSWLLQRANTQLDNSYERFVFMYPDSLWYREKFAKAAVAYTLAIKQYPKSERLARASYRLGLSYVNTGERKLAVKILTPLSKSNHSLWSNSAKQELELLDWEEKYSLVLKDLPPAGLGIKY